MGYPAELILTEAKLGGGHTTPVIPQERVKRASVGIAVLAAAPATRHAHRIPTLAPAALLRDDTLAEGREPRAAVS